jgi:hypothetical protein
MQAPLGANVEATWDSVPPTVRRAPHVRKLEPDIGSQSAARGEDNPRPSNSKLTRRHVRFLCSHLARQ